MVRGRAVARFVEKVVVAALWLGATFLVSSIHGGLWGLC